MKDDNTPTVTARRRKLTPHQRLRLGKAKELQKLGALTKKKRDESKKQKPGETDPEKMVSIAPRLPKLPKDTLSKPGKAPAKFRKRQVHKAWLPTHLYHAKRAHITPPKEPLWRFAVPLSPTNKCYRSTHRAASMRGCVVWDASYMSSIGVDGVEASLLGLLRSVGVEEKILTGKGGAKWRRGTRGWEGWIRERDGEKRWIAPVAVVWCLDESATEDGSGFMQENDVVLAGDAKKTDGGGLETGANQEDMVMQETTDIPQRAANQQQKKPKRRLLLRVHPSAFLQVWDEILKAAKIQRPPAMVEDLRFEIGSIEVTGPGSTEALIGVLHPVQATQSTRATTGETRPNDDWVDMETPDNVWQKLTTVTNPASLPANAMLSFNISDPRLHHPPRTVHLPNPNTNNDTLTGLLSSWPPDDTQKSPEIFDRSRRLTSSRLLASQKAINRRKGDALPGAYPEPSPKDPKIPVLLVASRSSTVSGQGTWTLLLPWGCVLPVWYSLMHYPLSSGGNPRFGGLQEKRQIAFEQGVPWFPGDYPGTKAGFEWEVMERERNKQKWEKRPKGRRIEYDTVDLGHGKKGEVGMGWACDWERLFQGPPAASSQDADNTQKSTSGDNDETTTKTPHSGASAPKPKDLSSIAPQPPNLPLAIHHLPNPFAYPRPIPPTALAPIHLTLLTTGHPTCLARIYRLPTTNLALRDKWLALSQTPRPGKHRKAQASSDFKPISKDAPPRIRSQQLAARLLTRGPPATTSPPKPGEKEYPPVPEEIDLIGFVTTGNYNLGDGRCECIGNVAVAKARGEREDRDRTSSLCIVREAGERLGRLARWNFV